MANNDELWALVFGGIIGAAISAPKPEDKQELNEYRNIKQQLKLRAQRLGRLPDIEMLRAKPVYYNVFVEAYKMHIHGFFRGATLLSASLIESLLGEKYNKNNMNDLIEEAGNNNIISKEEYHYLHGLRYGRNEAAHNIFNEVREEDSNLILRITIKLLDKILSK